MVAAHQKQDAEGDAQPQQGGSDLVGHGVVLESVRGVGSGCRGPESNAGNAENAGLQPIRGHDVNAEDRAHKQDGGWETK